MTSDQDDRGSSPLTSLSSSPEAHEIRSELVTPPRHTAARTVPPGPPRHGRRAGNEVNLAQYRPRLERSVSPTEAVLDARQEAMKLRNVLEGGRPRVDPIPFERPTQNNLETLYDLLRCKLPNPPIANPNKEPPRGTKSLNQRELSMNVDGRLDPDVLKDIVYAPQMLDKVVLHVQNRTAKMPIHWNDPRYVDLVQSVVPWRTTSILPPFINTEKDTEDWGLYAGIAPLMLILDALLCKDIPSRPVGTGEPRRPGAPYVISSSGIQGVFPDAIVVGQDGQTKAVIEYKADSVLSVSVTETTTGPATLLFEDIQAIHWINGTPQPNFAVKFMWPRAKEIEEKRRNGTRRWLVAENEHTKYTKVLVQKWTEMTTSGVKFGMLSTFNATVFLFRRGNCMFMSRTYHVSDSDSLIAMLCWLMLSFGLVREDEMMIPSKVNSDWYLRYPEIAKEVEAAEREDRGGVVEATTAFGMSEALD